MREAHRKVADHYNRFPYPRYPMWMQGRWKDLESVDVTLWGGHLPARDIWVAGCGSIQAFMFARRNFGARVLATDLSKKSLSITQMRARIFGVRNLVLEERDLMEAQFIEQFDYADAFGVIHHLEEPVKALHILAQSLRKGGILRLMLYSESARSSIEILRAEIKSKGIHEISELKTYLSKRGLESELDFNSEESLADALLHPLVHVFSEASAKSMIAECAHIQVLRFESEGNFVVYLRKT